MSATIALGKRALREAVRQPDALLMTMFIPIFFLVVNTGQAAEIFPSASTEFLKGQGYGAFQLPITLLLAASFGMAALFLVEEIEGGYFDKLRAIPIPRYALVLGRLVAEAAKCVVIASLIVLIALPFGITIASGLPGFVLLVMLTKPMEVAATLNPVTYLMEAMRSLILDDLAWEKILPGFGVVAALGALMLALTVRTIQRYD
jgi:ABC-2 type transport system permease protein